jgi:predicted transcriptional regulator
MTAGTPQSGRPYPYKPTATTAAGQKLDRFLTEAIDDLGAKKMPDGKPTSLREAMQAVTRAAEAVRSQALDKAERMRTDIESNGALVLKKMDDIHQDAMSELNAVLGNERAGDQG